MTGGMRLVVQVLSALAVTALLPACLAGCNRQVEEPLLAPLEADEISGERLWERIASESDYTSYAFWPGHEGERPGQAPHGVIHRIYVNRTLLEGLPAADLKAPAGSIIVKDNLDASGNLGAITVMAKVPGFDPENGDWYWARYTPDGTAAAAGSLQSCIVCHAGVADNDYVIVRPLDKPFAAGK